MPGCGATARGLARPLLAAILLALVGGPAAAAAAPSAAGGAAWSGGRAAWSGGRRQLRAASDRPQRQLTALPPCVCPAVDDAKAACANVSQSSKDDIVRTTIQFCQKQGFIPVNCCPAMPINDTEKWQQWSACLCAGDNPSITAFVDGLQVVQNCGCYAGVPSAPANGSGAAPAGLGRSATGLISGLTGSNTSGGTTGGTTPAVTPPASPSPGAPGGTGNTPQPATSPATPPVTQAVLQDISKTLVESGQTPLSGAPGPPSTPGSSGGGSTGSTAGGSGGSPSAGNSNANSNKPASATGGGSG